MERILFGFFLGTRSQCFLFYVTRSIQSKIDSHPRRVGIECLSTINSTQSYSSVESSVLLREHSISSIFLH